MFCSAADNLLEGKNTLQNPFFFPIFSMSNDLQPSENIDFKIIVIGIFLSKY